MKNPFNEDIQLTPIIASKRLSVDLGPMRFNELKLKRNVSNSLKSIKEEDSFFNVNEEVFYSDDRKNRNQENQGSEEEEDKGSTFGSPLPDPRNIRIKEFLKNGYERSKNSREYTALEQNHELETYRKQSGDINTEMTKLNSESQNENQWGRLNAKKRTSSMRIIKKHTKRISERKEPQRSRQRVSQTHINPYNQQRAFRANQILPAFTLDSQRGAQVGRILTATDINNGSSLPYPPETPSGQDADNGSVFFSELSVVIPENKITPQLKQELRREYTKISELGYFGDDQRDDIKRDAMKDKYFFHRYLVGFSLLQYSVFLGIHLLIYGLLGPFSLLAILVYPKLRFLFSNLLMSRFLSISFAAQTYYWICSVMIYYAIYSGMGIGDYMLAHTLTVSLLFRSCTIAGKYATFQPLQVKKYFTVYISSKELNNELMMIDWLRQTSEIVFEEISYALKRLEIDISTLKISFFVPLNKQVEDEFNTICEQRNDFDLIYRENPMFRDGKKVRYYDGRVVFEYLVKQFNKMRVLSWWYLLLLGSLSLLYGVTPGIFRAYRGNSFHGEGWAEIAIFYCTSLSNCFMIFTTTMFWDQAIKDLDLKNFILERLSHMVSPRKVSHLSKVKIMPTINIADPVSLTTWLNLRRVCLDYGLRFFYRHQIFIPALLLVGLVSIVAAFALYYLKIGDRISNSYHIDDLIHCLILDFTFVFIMFFRLLFKSARVNSHFKHHLEILRFNKRIFLELRRHFEYYFSQYLPPQEQEALFRKKFWFFGKKSDSYINKRVAKELYETTGSLDAAENVLDSVVDMVSELIEGMESEKEFSALKILNMEVTDSGAWNLFFAFCSVIATAYEIMLT